MEQNPGIQSNYFDYVISLYSISYTSNTKKTFELSYEYLKKDGKFILCWTHPFFNCLSIEEEKVVVTKSYL